ncbi:M23 family metallopeptidase [Nitriliruptoraceae bacterium ZYF776]|nr:M23 family metallopeptidase [Profundirhabdus halotolerans]
MLRRSRYVRRPARPAPRFAARRRRRWPVVALVVALGVLAAIPVAAGQGQRGGPSVVAGVAATRDAQTVLDRAVREPDLATTGGDAASAAPDPRPDAAPVPAPTPTVGRRGPLTLHVPVADPIVVGFHEAATIDAHAISPVGRLVANRNPTRLDDPGDEPGGTDYLMLSSRGRSAAPTSAIDVVARDDDPILSPVTGTVTDVREYLLYGRHVDRRIEIVPDADPAVRVVVIHVDGVAVQPGDHVEGGVSPIAATANRFPFSSHIDRETEPDRWPHVHIEVQPRDAPRPGDDLEDASADAPDDTSGAAR